MDIYNSISSASGVLNEQIACQIFDILPDDGPIMLIVDREGNCWPSDSERFADLGINTSDLKEMCEKIDDGAEPVISQLNDCSVIASQLVTERTNCGYVVIALPQYSPESTLINGSLLEVLLNQVCLIAKLIEKNSLLYELQLKQFSSYSQGGEMVDN